MIKKLSLILKFMTSQTRNMRNIFPKKSYTECGGEATILVIIFWNFTMF